MQSNKTRIRKDYAPLTVAVSVRCTTPASPTTQVYNGGNNEYEPDRTVTPTTILPEVVANAADGSWPSPSANHALADMKWFVNGEDISTLSDWAGKYSIDQVGSTRGALTISRNVTASEKVQLHFEAVLADSRLGVTLPIVTDPILLTTTEKAGDGYGISIADGNNILYDPVKDRLALYDYKVAQGIIAASATEQTAATDTNAYLHSIPISVFCGTDPVTSGFTVKLYRLDSGTLTQLTAGAGEAVSISGTQIVLDLRPVKKADYVIKVEVAGKEVAMVEFGVSRVFQKYHISPTNGTGIHPSDTHRYDEAMVDCDGNIVEYPERIYKIVWFTDSDTKTAVQHNEGTVTVFALDTTGIGSDYNDSWLDVYCTSEYKPEHKFATDSSGNFFTDASGNRYIFN